MYKPRRTNCADALTRQEQDLENQAASKIALQTQTLLLAENLDPRILEELAKSFADAKICLIKAPDLDLINELLQTNRTSVSLQEYRKGAEQSTGPWTLEQGLLKHQDQLVVAEDNELRT
jgi:hypothetical protein